MIRKINVLLIIVSIIGAVYIAFTKDDKLVLILKDLSIILTITAPYIIQRLFKTKINEGLKFVYIIFIFIAHFLGTTCEFYNHISWFDKFAHYLSGVLSSFVAIYILVKVKNKNSVFFKILFILSFALAVAAAWEIFEYLSSYYFNVDPQRVALTGVTDTMGDIIVAFLGSILVSFCYYYEHKENRNLFIKKFEKMV